MSKYQTFECSYAVLAENIHTAALGNLDKVLVVGKASDKQIMQLTKFGDIFEVQVMFRKAIHTVVMPVEHVRYMVPASDKTVKSNGPATKA